MGERILVVNADDFALTERLSLAILDAHRCGIVTSTSLLAVAPAFDHAVRLLGDAPDLGVGLHLAAVGEDPPLLSAREVPTLVDRRGRFPITWRSFFPRVALGRVDPDDLRREFTAQADRVRGAGLSITHVDSHQHIHLWPSIAEVAVEVALGYGAGGVRVTRSARHGPVGLTITRLASRLERQVQRSGLHATGGFAGLDETGRMDLDRLCSAVNRLGGHPATAVEICTHPRPLPGADPALDRYASDWVRADEHAALVHPRARETVARAGFVLGTFADVCRA